MKRSVVELIFWPFIRFQGQYEKKKRKKIFSVKSLAKAYLSDKEICIFKQSTTQGPSATRRG